MDLEMVVHNLFHRERPNLPVTVWCDCGTTKTINDSVEDFAKLTSLGWVFTGYGIERNRRLKGLCPDCSIRDAGC